MKNQQRYLICLLLLATSIGVSSCRHMRGNYAKEPPEQMTTIVERKVSAVFMPQGQRMPPHILFQIIDRYNRKKSDLATPFKLTLATNPLMRDVKFTAQIKYRDKILRDVNATKTATSSLNDQKTRWSSSHSKLALLIPFTGPDEEVVVTTSFEWMDIRFMPPIFLQDPTTKTLMASLTVDIPYGITMHFNAAKNKKSVEFIPTSLPHEEKAWAVETEDKHGVRYSWHAVAKDFSDSSAEADLLQLFLSFEPPWQNEIKKHFDNWDAVSSFIYDRFDRFDMPSDEIRAFTIREAEQGEDLPEKVNIILAFLQNSIDRRADDQPLYAQFAQPATRTFSRRFGSNLDVAILGKAMLTSIGIDAEIMAAADRRFNPHLSKCYSPVLFSTTLLAIPIGKNVLYYDPGQKGPVGAQLDRNFQGQPALVLKAKGGFLQGIPYADSQKNAIVHSYQLSLGEDGMMEGEYSTDLSGFLIDRVNDIIGRNASAINLSMIEKAIYRSSPPFSLASCDIAKGHSPEAGIRLSGHIKPFGPMPGSKTGSSLIQNIIEPAIETLLKAQDMPYSSMTKISLFLALPNGLLVKNLPKNLRLSEGGVDTRFLLSASDGQLILEGTVIIALPLKADGSVIADHVNKLRVFSGHEMVFDNSAIDIGAADGQGQGADQKAS